jgi:predicted ribosome quality control (RQC) complex YloA/Tae2 family protein
MIRVAAVLARSLARSVLREFHQESDHRYRLVFERDGVASSVVISLHPNGPWIGRPSSRSESFRQAPGPFAARCRAALRLVVLEGLAKGPDRSVTFEFVDGHRLVAELVPHRSNLWLLDGAGRLVVSARRPPRDRHGMTRGELYRPAGLPARSLNPVDASAAQIDAFVSGPIGAGTSPVTALSRGLFGVSDAAARLILEEGRATGDSIGTVLASRVSVLIAGAADPILEGPGGRLPDPGTGDAEPMLWCLLPWEPQSPAEASRRRFRGEDAAETAGLYYGMRERERESVDRAQALLKILDAEITRRRRAESHIQADLASFEDPDRYRIWAEALLAGLNVASRDGEHVRVPDPYDPDGGPVSVPVSAGLSLPQAVETLFRRHRRARRGLERARERAAKVAAERERLERLRAQCTGPPASDAASALEREMRRCGIAVGLQPTRGRRAVRRSPAKPRLEGVRLLAGPDDRSILVGKGGRENDRLTFKLAGPEDFWFHALGVPGAHVVVRNAGGETRPPGALLRQAAAVAAWYSDARKQPQADVQWTRRKYVRRLKGAGPGTVKVKKSETVRVRPGVPDSW